MGTVRYTVVHGEVIAEKRGGVRRSYVPDPLGSTVALLDTAQAQTDTFTYWPYGEVRTRTGTTATPLQFVGTLGYYRDSSGRAYVQVRTLRTDLGQWQTTSNLITSVHVLNVAQYASSNPETGATPFGTAEWIPGSSVTGMKAGAGFGVGCGDPPGFKSPLCSKVPPKCPQPKGGGSTWDDVCWNVTVGGRTGCCKGQFTIESLAPYPVRKPCPQSCLRLINVSGPAYDLQCEKSIHFRYGRCVAKISEAPGQTGPVVGV
jgi:hypothetical protein